MYKVNFRPSKLKISFIGVLFFLTTSAFAIYPVIRVIIPYYPEEPMVNARMVVINAETKKVEIDSSFDNLNPQHNFFSISSLLPGRYYLYLQGWYLCEVSPETASPAALLTFEVSNNSNHYRIVTIPLTGGNNFAFSAPSIVLDEVTDQDLDITIMHIGGHSS